MLTILMRFIVASACAPPERAAADESPGGGPVSADETVLEAEGVAALSLAFLLSDFLAGTAAGVRVSTADASGWSAAEWDEERALPAAAASIVD